MGPPLMSNITTYFHRRAFHGAYSETPPKWHIYVNTPNVPIEWSVCVAVCGYNYTMALGSLTVSQTSKPRAAATVCKKCQRKIATATP